ncbi:MAG TPA: hypothetical protein VJ810_02820 [Blastocatellia bacterium]|nr:hypothetical protein [Blastocatellia bacterium]
MSAVTLKIHEPLDGQNYVGARNARLRGELASTGHGALFFKWYSSLADSPLGTTLDFTAALPVGSQVLIFSAKDQAGETPAELQAVRHAGMAGGPPLSPPPTGYSPRLIHVIVAEMREPAVNGATLSKANSRLIALAPSQWDKPEYQTAVNRLQYRWLFAPTPADGRKSAEIKTGLVFDVPGKPPNDAAGAVPRLRFQGPLPAELGLGNYKLTLRVERKDNATIGHEVSRDVVLIN